MAQCGLSGHGASLDYAVVPDLRRKHLDGFFSYEEHQLVQPVDEDKKKGLIGILKKSDNIRNTHILHENTHLL